MKLVIVDSSPSALSLCDEDCISTLKGTMHQGDVVSMRENPAIVSLQFVEDTSARKVQSRVQVGQI